MTLYRQHPAAISTELGDEAVTLQLDTKRYFTLNASAACAWRSLAEGANEDAIARALASEFDIAHDEARGYAATLVQQFLELRLVEECESDTGSRSQRPA
ncbi:MAG: PqqD family protein [Gemmatimonadaceae bacterium]